MGMNRYPVRDVGVDFPEPSLTKQSFKDECDLNLIMKRFKNQNGEEFLNRYRGYLQGDYGDFSDVVDYRTALDRVKRANEAFDGLPAEVRRKFENDPGVFIEFATNPANHDEMVSLGLATKRAPVQDAPSQA